MKITKRQLKRIIKEEKAKLIKEQYGSSRPGRAEADALLEEFRAMGVSDTQILEYILLQLALSVF